MKLIYHNEKNKKKYLLEIDRLSNFKIMVCKFPFTLNVIVSYVLLIIKLHVHTYVHIQYAAFFSDLNKK